MEILQPILIYLAPDNCIGCQNEGMLLCDWCRSSTPHVASSCVRCGQPSSAAQTCPPCRQTTPLDAVVRRAPYTDPWAQELIRRLKFNGSQTVAKVMADMLAQRLQAYATSQAVVTYAPTAHARVRSRGYDQSKLIARHIARQLGLPCATLLRRHGQTDQIGASRTQRYEQLQSAFSSSRPVRHATVILVDDVMTTGATLEAAAGTLKQAGAQTVVAAVFAAA